MGMGKGEAGRSMGEGTETERRRRVFRDTALGWPVVPDVKRRIQGDGAVFFGRGKGVRGREERVVGVIVIISLEAVEVGIGVKLPRLREMFFKGWEVWDGMKGARSGVAIMSVALEMEIQCFSVSSG